MARSLDSLGWSKVGVCSCVVCMREGCARARGAVGNRITSYLCAPLSYCFFLPPLSCEVPSHLDLSSPSKNIFCGHHWNAGVRFQGILPLAHNKIVALQGAGQLLQLPQVCQLFAHQTSCLAGLARKCEDVGRDGVVAQGVSLDLRVC